jgi:epoxyqueuosine reductase
MNFPDILETSLRSAGVSAFGFLSGERLRAACAGLGEEKRARYGVERAQGAVAAALAYGEGLTPWAPGSDPPLGPWASGYPGPGARIARFARANWYAELGSRLALASRHARAALSEGGADPGPESDWRRLVNSGLPEKRLALEAGIGKLGRHCLLMTPDAGSAVVLGLLLLPLPLPDYGLSPASADPQGLFDPDCLSCGACVAACPTGALRGDGSLDRELCLQHWSSIPGDLPDAVDAAWGDRLYGCDLCQESCPRFRPDDSARTGRGLLGPALPASWVVAASEGEIRAGLKGSALGMSWISVEALRRNARHLTVANPAPTIEGKGGLDEELER